MSENLKNHEQQAENSNTFSGLAELPAFNPEQAQENVDRAKEQLAKKTEGEKPKFDARLTGLQVMAEKPKVTPVEELSEKDAAQEYLDLLMDLSSGFTSPEGKASRVVSKGRDGSETIVNRGYSGDSKLAESLLERATSKEELKAIKKRDHEGIMSGEFRDPNGAISSNEYLDRAHSLMMADNILRAEALWEEGGKKAESFDEAKHNAAKDALEQYKEKDSKKFFLTKFFTRKKRAAELSRLEAEVENTSMKGGLETAVADGALKTALSEAYDTDYGYGSHKEAYGTSKEEIERRNEQFNNQFFSKENQAKIARAVALRNKLYGQPHITRKDAISAQRAGVPTGADYLYPDK